MSVDHVIWSEEHGAWWAAEERGYTRSLAAAGRYTKARAAEIVAKANYAPGIFHEVALADPLNARLIGAAARLARALNDCLIVMEAADAGDSVAAQLARDALREAGVKVEHMTTWGAEFIAKPGGPT